METNKCCNKCFYLIEDSLLCKNCPCHTQKPEGKMSKTGYVNAMLKGEADILESPTTKLYPAPSQSIEEDKCGLCCKLVPPRCKGKDCKCHIPTQQKEEKNWEEEFEEKWYKGEFWLNNNDGYDGESMEKIKQFFSTELSRARRETTEEIATNWNEFIKADVLKIRKSTIDEIERKVEEMNKATVEVPLHECGYIGYCEHYPILDARHRALEGILSLLKQMNKE